MLVVNLIESEIQQEISCLGTIKRNVIDQDVEIPILDAVGSPDKSRSKEKVLLLPHCLHILLGQVHLF